MLSSCGSLSSLDDCHRIVTDGQDDQAFHKLCSVLQQAAVSAGCSHKSTSKPRKGLFRDEPYFEDEGRQLRAKFGWAAQHDPGSGQVLACRFPCRENVWTQSAAGANADRFDSAKLPFTSSVSFAATTIALGSN